MRASGRSQFEIRKIEIETNVMFNTLGSCLIKMGNTHVICSVSLDEVVPYFLRGKGSGWLTAEYSMLPGSTSIRVKRENQKPSGRTQEIQRIIGRSLRSVLDLKKLGERHLIVDCDVINADGGTRCASINGGYIALVAAIKKMKQMKILNVDPIQNSVTALSCGINDGSVLLDMNYEEDSKTETDANFVFDKDGKLVEVQASAERFNFSDSELVAMMVAAGSASNDIRKIQKRTIDSL